MSIERQAARPRLGSRPGRVAVTLVAGLLCLAIAAPTHAQLPSALYTWDNTGNAQPNIESWVRNFGGASTSATLDNATPGRLTIVETSATLGGTQAFTDGANRVRESATNASGGTDLTGLDFLEFDLGHNGVAPVNVQFFVQAGIGFSFVGLGPDIAVQPGMNTYQLPLTGLTPDQAVYIRTMGINVRDHAAQGNLTWFLDEVRSGGTPLTTRTLVSHNVGTPEGGLQGAIANFDQAAIAGNNGGQNQTGLSHNAAGPGSLQWTDLGGSNGAAVSWGNGTAWNGNTFNNRTTDLSGYETMVVRISATDPAGGGGTLGMNAFIQGNDFQFESLQGGAGQTIPIDGQFHLVSWSMAGLNNENAIDLTGINLFAHSQNLVINVDYVRFAVPEPSTMLLGGLSLVAAIGASRRRRAA